MNRGPSYSPYFNTLGVVLCFDYQDADSFGNLMIWYNETLRYCNLKNTHYMIVGYNKNDDPKVKDDDVSGFIDYFPMNKRPRFFNFSDNNKQELTNMYKEFCDEIIGTEFIQTYKQVSKAMEKKPRASSFAAGMNKLNKLNNMGKVDENEDETLVNGSNKSSVTSNIINVIKHSNEQNEHDNNDMNSEHTDNEMTIMSLTNDSLDTLDNSEQHDNQSGTITSDSVNNTSGKKHKHKSVNRCIVN